MKLNTKYNIGDEVWYANMQLGKVFAEKGTVGHIDIHIFLNKQEIEYFVGNGFTKREMDLFSTKQEAVKHLETEKKRFIKDAEIREHNWYVNAKRVVKEYEDKNEKKS